MGLLFTRDGTWIVGTWIVGTGDSWEQSSQSGSWP